MNKDYTKQTKTRDASGRTKVLEELHHIEEIEYGTKELIHGVLIGIVIGFFLALILMG